MYQAIYVEKGEQWGQDTVHIWDDALGYKTVPYNKFSYAYKPDKKGKYISMTGVRLAKVNRWSRSDPSLFESDLPQETRVLTDLYLHDDDPSTGHNVMFFDIEVSMETGKPNVGNPQNEITAIAYYDMATTEYNALVLDKAGLYTNRTSDGTNVFFFRTELDLLYAFLDKYEEMGPTIISGWNSDGFDIPYLYGRIRNLCGPNTAGRLSPIGKLKYAKFRNKWVIAGVSALDYLDLYKKFTYTQLPNYRLDTVAKTELGRGKIAYSGTLDELFSNDLDEFIRYNIEDVRLLVEMDAKLKLIELVRGICHMGHVPYEDYSYSSKFLEGTIVTYLHRQGIIATNKPDGGKELMEQRDEDDEEESFSGAYVRPPAPALYKWVYSLDLQSLYPSIIMSLNISPETKIGVVTNYDVDKHMNGELTEYHVRGTDETTVVTLSKEKFVKYMASEKMNISSNGVLYTTATKGIIPSILNSWFHQRIEYKGLMKKYKTEGNEELADFYDRRQHIQKIFLNSLYGVLGLPIFRFFDIDNALAVTASGQDVIKKSARFVSDLYVKKNAPEKTPVYLMKYKTVLDKEVKKPNNKLTQSDITELLRSDDHCIYIDTDSLYFSSEPLLPPNTDAKEFTIALSRAIESRLNVFYNQLAQDAFFCNDHRLFIEGESVSETGIWIAKKRYALNVVYDLETNTEVDHKMKVKGLDVVRSTFPPAFRDLMKDLMKDILNLRSKDDINAKILEFRSHLEEMDYINVARNTSVNKLEKYETGGPAQVKAAKNYNKLLQHYKLDNQYEFIKNGDKIKWVYLSTNPLRLETMAMKGDNDPPEIVDIIKQYIDYNKLFEKELVKKLEDFFNAMDWGNIPTKMNQNVYKFFS